MSTQAHKVKKKAEEQPLILKELLSALVAARRQASLYGIEHKSSEESVKDLKATITSIIRRLGSCTIVLTKERLVVNDRSYLSSGDSQNLCQRLRARGAMGVSFVADPSPEEVTKLIQLLNAEPADVREAGGPGSYLQRLDVHSILATDAVYTARGSSGNMEETLSEDDIDPALLDPAVRALIERTCNEGVGGDFVEVPLTDILSSPDATAKLIWESVIKLHSTSSQSVGELGFQVIHNLKGMAANKKEVWDLTTLQIRKAIAKLPDEVRSTAFGFLTDMDADRRPSDTRSEPAEKETAAADVPGLGPTMDPTPGSDAPGLTPSWQKELQASTVLKYSGRTLAMLMAWEFDPIEHGRLARALALLIPQGLGMSDVEGALMFTESLLKEADITDAPPWRAANAKSALQSLDMHTLRSLVESALASESSPHVVALLIDTVSSLSLVLADFLRTDEHRTVTDAIKRSLVKSGSEATAILADALRDESPIARQAALEILIQMGTDLAIHAVSFAMDTADDYFVITALGMLPSVRNQSATQICAHHVRHKSPEVRIAALRALGALGDQLAMGILIQAATQRTRNADEQIAAIHALGQIRHPDTAICLRSIAGRRSFFWRSRCGRLRAAAEQALSQLGEAANED